jgi:TRAP-type C4-dicarboxylate transport system substrate-binding protein
MGAGRTRWFLVLATVVATGFAADAARADDDSTTLKIGTLAPADSPWGQVFKSWARNVDQRTNGALTLDWQWGGTAGDENQMVSSMKSNQLDGAAITAVGLGQIYQDVLVFQLPGAFADWGALSAARDKVRPQLDSSFESAGFKILGWGDVGAGKIMSNGFAVHGPSDLKGKGAFYISGDPIGPQVFKIIGGITPKQVSVPEILPGLQNNTITVVNAPPLAAQQLQWAASLTDINTLTTGYGIGALVIAKARYDQLPDDAKDALTDTGGEAANKLTSKIRQIDAAAFAQMKNNKNAYEPTDAEKSDWANVFSQTRAALKGNPLSASMYSAAGIN